MIKQSQSQLFSKYKRDANRRDIDFNVSLKYFCGKIAQNCYYCDSEPASIFKNGKKSRSYELVYNGIDRIDNKKGYLPRNCVAACKRCNYAKAKLTKQEFLDMVKEVYRTHHN